MIGVSLKWLKHWASKTITRPTHNELNITKTFTDAKNKNGLGAILITDGKGLSISGTNKDIDYCLKNGIPIKGVVQNNSTKVRSN